MLTLAILVSRIPQLRYDRPPHASALHSSGWSRSACMIGFAACVRPAFLSLVTIGVYDHHRAFLQAAFLSLVIVGMYERPCSLYGASS
ncbi:hypothetical protein CALVIDRAFT_538709 [Calocera viscosa TUFC12733]|uniref:Uncharacterized protein n=1 Tax=Calocera viscosa (strain TUFC12733) TaxID=1330018 RepID=A0A167KRZ6_CALVF|nr:hypothetical protein CALVIDRAFT_538709 [Calocera viscosa TUFC12733]